MRNKLKKPLALLLAAVTMISVLAACRDSEAPPENTVSGENIAEEIKDLESADNIFSLNSTQTETFNPYTDTSVLNHAIMPLVYENLFDVDSTFSATPVLIRDFSSPDGISWTFYVDTERKFQDGSSLTAYDVAYSLIRAKNGNKYGGRLSNMYGVTAMNDEMFLVSLSKANLQLPSLLNIPVIKDGAFNDIAPLGTGAYMFNSDHTQLRLWDGHPKAAEMPIDTIYLKECLGPEETIAAFEDSIIDLVTNDPTGIGDLGYGGAQEKRYINTTNLNYIGFNQNSAFFCYPKFRYFLTFAIDRDNIVSDMMGGCAAAATLPIHPSSALFNQTYSQNFVFNMEKAAISLKNAGADDLDADGLLEFMMGAAVVDIKIDFIVCGDTAAKVASAREIAEKMRALGLEVNLRELNWNAYKDALATGDFDMYYAEVKLSADFNLDKLLTKNGVLNFGKIEGDFGTSIDEYLAAKDEERQMYCDLMCRIIAENAPIVPICFERTEVLTHRGVVSGALPTQYNIYSQFENWTINVN